MLNKIDSTIEYIESAILKARQNEMPVLDILGLDSLYRLRDIYEQQSKSVIEVDDIAEATREAEASVEKLANKAVKPIKGNK